MIIEKRIAHIASMTQKPRKNTIKTKFNIIIFANHNSYSNDYS